MGSIINEDNNYTEEIKARIGASRNALSKIKNILCNSDLTIGLKTRLLEYVTPFYVLL